MANTLIIDGVDFSSYVQWQVDRLETTRKVYGPNNLIDIDGKEYPDLIANKIDPGFLLKPLPKSMLQTLYTIMRHDVVTMTHTTFSANDTRTIEAIPQDMQLKYACQAWNGDVYEGTAITFKEQ